MYQFNCENLGIALDIDIYSGFIHLDDSYNIIDVENDKPIYESVDLDSSECPELYTIIDEQLDKFRSRFSKGRPTKNQEQVRKSNGSLWFSQREMRITTTDSTKILISDEDYPPNK